MYNEQVIWITQKAYNKLFGYVVSTPQEVSGLGIVEEVQGIGVAITDVYLLDQVCGPASTELDPLAVSKLLIELSKQGKEKNLLCWWHSHADMGVFWSGTDNTTIQGLKSGSYFVSIVVNKRFDMKARIELYSPVSISLDDIPVKVLPDITDIPQDIKDEINAKVASIPIPTNPFIQRKDKMMFSDYELYQDEQELYDDVMLEVMAESAGKNLSEKQLEKLYQERLVQYGITQPHHEQNDLVGDELITQDTGGIR
jgi:proteasome lid subunit RPN8/RPN11